jgi:hypothetical protein
METVNGWRQISSGSSTKGGRLKMPTARRANNHASVKHSIPLVDRWKMEREMFTIRKITQADGAIEEVRQSIPINGWEKVEGGKWINPSLGITTPID